MGADRARDLVVVRINAARELLRPMALGTSGNLRVGQQVLAIGNPFGEHACKLYIGAEGRRGLAGALWGYGNLWVGRYWPSASMLVDCALCPECGADFALR